MLLEKEILIWKSNVGLTVDLDEVIQLPQSDFPRLIFQDLMNQLKLSKIKIGFELNTNQLIEMEPVDLEQLDKHKFDLLNISNTINLSDILTYYLLTQLLKSNFYIESIYTNNHSKSTLSFLPVIPFNKRDDGDSFETLKRLIIDLPIKTKQLTIERFFILLGDQFKDKLLLFLTYLDTKYKFKLNKTVFIESTLGAQNINKMKAHINQLI